MSAFAFLIQWVLRICGFLILRFNQLQIENIQKKKYIAVDMYYIARPRMAASVLNT